jgi:hypothetical protein
MGVGRSIGQPSDLGPAHQLVEMQRTCDLLTFTRRQQRMRQDGTSTGESDVTAPVIMTGTARSPLELAEPS